jgi:hypothetical protein
MASGNAQMFAYNQFMPPERLNIREENKGPTELKSELDLARDVQ